MRTTLIAVAVAILAGCATYRTQLTNDQGQTMVCEASGANGLVTGYFLRKNVEDCVAAAKEKGYK